MQFRRPGLLLGLLAPLAFTVASSCRTESLGSGTFKPFRTGWVPVIENAPFPYLDAEGMVAITQVQVGGTVFNDNFANRGEIVVRFTGPDNAITVEMREFTFAESEDDAQDDFDKLFPWIYSASPSSPKQPMDMDPEADCILNEWHNGCGIRVWYDGQIQPQRLGADIRVTLPASYRQDLFITTEDNTLEDAYQDRGNVCVENANASVDVQLESGRAYVAASPDLTPGPKCSPADIENCENYVDPDTMEAAAWDPNCACQDFGSFAIDSAAAGAANIKVDLPAGVWASMNLDNKATDPAGCVSQVTVPGAVIDPTFADQPHKEIAEINHPSDAAIQGGGFGVRLSSEGCGPVRFTENPEDYPGEDNEDDQDSEQRGNITVCSGADCLGGQSCEALLPWLG